MIPAWVGLTGPSGEAVTVEAAMVELVNRAMECGDGDPEESLRAWFQHDLMEVVNKRFPSWRGWGVTYTCPNGLLPCRQHTCSVCGYV